MPDLPGEKGKRLTPTAAYIKAFILYRTPKCRGCGRPLTSEKSIARGFGPGCGVHFGERWINAHPKHLEDRAKKLWTKEEVAALIKFAKEGT